MANFKKVYFGSDHGGYILKNVLMNYIEKEKNL